MTAKVHIFWKWKIFTPNKEDFRQAFNALREEAADTPEMSLEEINAEIAAARAERKVTNERANV